MIPKTSWIACFLVLLGTVSRVEAQAGQEGNRFVTVSVGIQASDSVTTISRPIIYDEAATITVPRDRGGLLVDVTGGFRLTPTLGFGVGFSSVGRSDSPEIDALVPNPLTPDDPREASATADDLSTRETAIHLQLRWTPPLDTAFDVALFAGPSFYKVSQDLVSDLDLIEGDPPFSTVAIDSVTTSSESAWATGFTIGADGTYTITPRYGANLFVRYSRATVDLPDLADGTTEVDAGGFQVGFGIRVRF